MGRPKKNEEKHATRRFALRLSPGLHEALEGLAKANDRTLSEEVRAGLEEHVERAVGRSGASSRS